MTFTGMCTWGKDFKNMYFASKKIRSPPHPRAFCHFSFSIHGFRNGSGHFFSCPDWLAYSLNLYTVTQSKSNWQKKECAVRSGFSKILNPLESHSFFIWTLSLVTQTNLIVYHISSIKSIQSGLAEIL